MVEKELLSLLKKISRDNDERSYKALYHLYFERLFRFALSIVKLPEAAEEIVSDVFVKIWEHRQRIANMENPRLYLYVSTKNFSLNYLSKKEKDIITCFENYDANIATLESNPEQLFITAEMVKRIQLAVQNLPPRCKIIFKLVKEDGLKHREVAELLGISVKTIEAQMVIALKKISNTISLNTTTASNPSSN